MEHFNKVDLYYRRILLSGQKTVLVAYLVIWAEDCYLRTITTAIWEIFCLLYKSVLIALGQKAASVSCVILAPGSDLLNACLLLHIVLDMAWHHFSIGSSRDYKLQQQKIPSNTKRKMFIIVKQTVIGSNSIMV